MRQSDRAAYLCAALLASSGCGDSGGVVSNGEAVGAPVIRDAAMPSQDDAAITPVDAPANPSAPARCIADTTAPQRTDYAKPGPHAVATLELTFDDATRPIPASDTHPASPSRTLPTTVYYPASSAGSLLGPAPMVPGGPFPLLMYSHGYSSSRSDAAVIATRAASHGYVVVAPDFPLTNIFANGGQPDAMDASNQPGDLSFLIDRVLALSKQPGHVLANGVDDTRIGATGVSMGGLTSLLLGFHPKLSDPRVRALAPIAALTAFFTPDFYRTRELPMLLVHGDNDAFVDYARNARAAWMYSQPRAWLMTVLHGTHAGFAIAWDPVLLALLNTVIGMPGTDPSNADGVGCGAVGSKLVPHPSLFPPELGGSENFIDETRARDALRACAGDEYTKPGLDTRVQMELTATAVVAFFDAHLGATSEVRQDGCGFLQRVLPASSDLTLE